jgi:cysteinyl-tRNA synthetase
MDDDFNTAGGLAAIFGLVTASNKYLADAAGSIETAVTLRAADALMELCGVLGIDLSKEVASSELPAELVTLAAERASYEGSDPEQAAQALLEARQAARAAKDWGTADAIRDGIAALGLVVEDTAAGARLRRKKD